MQAQPSLLTPIGYQNSSCGYCHQTSGSFSYYATTSSLSPTFYQSLLNRGWRRSGTLLYKPDLRGSCCPQYTIRLDSDLFHPSKDQRQVQNRFNKHVLGDAYIKQSARLYPKSREQAKKRNIEFNLVERVHEAEKEQIQTPPEPAHTLTITLESNEFTKEKYEVFENYQRLVHREPPSRISISGFKNFLCSSPLPSSTETIDGKRRQLGSYHQCYRLDGKLIAVGVLDLLPQCVSAVYFMYHESANQYNLGKLGALREIALAREKGYRWWYAGFYIHSCIKMRYKADYSPQFMLDPESHQWHPLDEQAKKRLDVNKYLTWSKDEATIMEEPSAEIGALEKPPATDSSSDHENDSDDEPQVPDPDRPLFNRSMPGVLSKEQIQRTIDLDHIKIRVGDIEAEACDLVSWGSDIEKPFSIQCRIAELAAAVGSDLAPEMIVAFG